MATQTIQHSVEDIARLGKEIYEQRIRPFVETENVGRVVAIDVCTGEYELGDSALDTTIRLRSRLLEAEIWLIRVGHLAYRYIRSAAG